jgi:hypothetical protein
MANPDWKKGKPKTGGRKKGTPNKITQDAREAFQEIMAGNVENVRIALEELYKQDKTKFLDVLSKYFPYFIPKQEQIDVSVKNMELPFNIKIESRKKTDAK